MQHVEACFWAFSRLRLDTCCSVLVHWFWVYTPSSNWRPRSRANILKDVELAQPACQRTRLSTDPSVDGQAGRLHNQLDTVTGVNLQHTQSACSHPRPATMVPWTGRRNSILGEKRLFRGEGISSQLLSIQTLSWFFHNKCCKAITLPALLRSSMRISLRGFSQSHH